MEAHGIAAAAPTARTPLLRARQVTVRTLDLVLGLVALVLALPLMAAIALAIRLDSPGPAVFRQRRVGHGGRSFTVNKFRTMGVEADEAVHRAYVLRLIGGDHHPVSDGRHSLYKLAVDDRITRVGRILRRLSLDELPQLWNVLRGEMSLVGPRPALAYEVEHYPGWYHERFSVKPGITGLWQVSGRNERTFEEMVQLDIEYARSWSVCRYLGIIIRTVWVVGARRGVA